ncbi:MAG: hypothetical protein WC681_12755 [Sterolibacterium sp.]|jgi:hypothetical protein
MAKDNFAESQTAYARVRETINELRAEYDQVSVNITAAETELAELPLAPVPAEDLKAGILEFIEASGRRYGADRVRGSIASFATGGMLGLSAEAGSFGKPLRFRDIDGAISGINPPMSWAQLLTPDGAHNDQVLYCFVADLVNEGLRRIMADMTPQELGYGTIHPNKIGTDRATRRAAITALEARLAELRIRKDDLAEKLRALGTAVK